MIEDLPCLVLERSKNHQTWVQRVEFQTLLLEASFQKVTKDRLSPLR